MKSEKPLLLLFVGVLTTFIFISTGCVYTIYTVKLTIRNNVVYCDGDSTKAAIYVDGSYIGTIFTDEEVTTSVVPGQHVIRVEFQPTYYHPYEDEIYERSYNITEDTTVEVWDIMMFGTQIRSTFNHLVLKIS